MKKVFMYVAVVAMIAAAASCKCNNESAEDCCAEPAKECCEEGKECCEKEAPATVGEAIENAAEEVKDAAEAAAIEKIDEAAAAAKDAIAQ